MKIALSAVTTAVAGVIALGSAAAQTPDKFTSINADDPSLKWGECDPVMPKGCMAAVIQGDPTKDNADLLVKFPPKYAFDPHTHTAAEHMVLLQGQMTMEYGDHPKATIKAGTFAYGPPKMAHKGSCDSDVPCILYINWDKPVDIQSAQSMSKTQ